jgi:hypothetical protein
MLDRMVFEAVRAGSSLRDLNRVGKRDARSSRDTSRVPLMSLAVLTMTLAQVLDLGTFVAMVRRLGLEAELNPGVSGLIGGYGLPMAAIAKVALMAFVVAIALVLSRRTGRVDRVAGGVVLAAAIVAGILGGATNVLTLWSL